MKESEYYFSILDILEVIVKHKKLIIFNCLLAASITSGIMYFIPNTYISRTTFLSPPDPFDNSSSNLDMLLFGASSGGAMPASNISSLLAGSKSSENIYIKLLKSRSTLKHIINKFNLKDYYNSKTNDVAIRKLNSFIGIEQSGMYLEVNVKDKDAKFAADIANELVNYLGVLINKLNTSSVTVQKNFFAQKISDIDKELKLKSDELIKFSAINKTINPDKQFENIINRISNLQSSIILLEAEENSLKTIYTENSPKIKEINTRLLTLKEELNNLINQKNSSNNIDFNLKDYPTLSKDYYELRQDVEIKNEILKTLTAQLEILKIKESKDKLDIKVIDFAEETDEKVGPQRTMNVLIVTVIVGILTILYKFITHTLLKIDYSSPIYKRLLEIKSEI